MQLLNTRKAEAKQRRVGLILRGLASAFCIYWLLCAIVPYVAYRVFNIAGALLIVLFVPLLLALLCWPTTTQLVARLRQTRVGRLLVNAVCALALLGVLYVLSVTAWMAATCLDRPDADGDAVCIVMGCQVNGEYSPSPLLANRLEAAENYLNSHPDALCIVTGCQGPDEAFSEAVVMKNCLVRSGIAEERIILEEQARNTGENLQYSAALMQELNLGSEAVIATDWWHQLRSARWAEKCGLSVSAACSPAPRPIIWVMDPVYYVRELLGMARMLCFGR